MAIINHKSTKILFFFFYFRALFSIYDLVYIIILSRYFRISLEMIFQRYAIELNIIKGQFYYFTYRLWTINRACHLLFIQLLQ